MENAVNWTQRGEASHSSVFAMTHNKQMTHLQPEANKRQLNIAMANDTISSKHKFRADIDIVSKCIVFIKHKSEKLNKNSDLLFAYRITCLV